MRIKSLCHLQITWAHLPVKCAVSALSSVTLAMAEVVNIGGVSPGLTQQPDTRLRVSGRSPVPKQTFIGQRLQIGTDQTNIAAGRNSGRTSALEGRFRQSPTSSMFARLAGTGSPERVRFPLFDFQPVRHQARFVTTVSSQRTNESLAASRAASP